MTPVNVNGFGHGAQGGEDVRRPLAWKHQSALIGVARPGKPGQSGAESSAWQQSALRPRLSQPLFKQRSVSTSVVELPRMTSHDIAPAGAEGNPSRIEYRGQPVMTTEQLARAYEVADNNIHMNKARNTDRFVEGVHFFDLRGPELKAFKNSPTVGGLVDKRVPGLILWTEHGALRHAKLLESPKAWEVFGKLEETYFAVRGGEVPAAAGPERFKVARENRLQFERHLSWARVMGLDGAHAMLAANRATIIATGHDTLGALGVLSAPDPVQEIVVIPTAIGEKLGGLSAQAVNSHLAAMGLQEREPLHKGKWRWKLTQVGLDAGGRYDVQSRSNNTGTARFIEWPLSVVDSVRSFLKGEEGEAA